MKSAIFTPILASLALFLSGQAHAAPPSGFFNQLCSALALKKKPATEATPEPTPDASPEVRAAITLTEVDLLPIGMNLIPGSSILFFKGFVPEPGTQWTHEFMKLSFKIHLFTNPESGVVLMYSKDGLSHAELKKLVPEGSEILGGVRFDQSPKTPGEVRIINSTHFGHFNGPEILDHNFKLKF
jgi:hypothetical protein